MAQLLRDGDTINVTRTSPALLLCCYRRVVRSPSTVLATTTAPATTSVPSGRHKLGWSHLFDGLNMPLCPCKLYWKAYFSTGFKSDKTSCLLAPSWKESAKMSQASTWLYFIHLQQIELPSLILVRFNNLCRLVPLFVKVRQKYCTLYSTQISACISLSILSVARGKHCGRKL
jgi:hypothetical protein